MQAAVRMARADEGVPAFISAIEGRITAVARAQTLLADRQWSGADLRALVEAALSAFTDGGPGGRRVRLDGPDVALRAAAVQPLSMAVHELATNAVKYGALSVPEGSVSVSWRVDRAAGALRLRWAEAHGPALAGPPLRRGFGSRVIRATVCDQLGGRVEQDWGGNGLVCAIALPLSRVADPAAAG